MAEKQEKMRILYTAFEAVPFLKLGGLGDVAGTLPMSVHAHKCDIRVIIPYHSLIKKEHLTRIKKEGDYSVEFMGKDVDFELWSVKQRGVVFYLIKNSKYFDRPQAYGEKDDLERFTFFSRAILACIGNMGKFIPQILHCNDWHTALAALYLHEDFADKLDKYNIKTLFTIHNLQYQGKFKYEKVKDILCLKGRSAVNKVMHKGKVNLMKTGIVVSDAVSTPSPNYAKEILTYDYGEGLETVLKRRAKETFGILNGIDYVDFNPAWDTNIKVHFTKDLIERRLGNKIDLQRQFKLKEDPYTLVSCVACRFYEQKGISLIIEAVPKIIEKGGQVLFLGDGDAKYKKKIEQFQKKYKGMVSAHLQFDPYLPHNLYAGADLLLMPSKFEPCGVAQMMAMHYGTLPLVRSTGGLKDTVHNYEPKSLVCNGFVFKNYNIRDFEKALDTVFKVWNNDHKNWVRMQKRAMDKDFSWKESGRKYCVLYDALVEDKLDTVTEQLDSYAIAHATQRAHDAAAKAARHAKDRAELARKELKRAQDSEFVDIRMIDWDDEAIAAEEAAEAKKATAANKTAAKKTAAKKTTDKKPAAKKTAAKKTAAKKPTTKKATAKKATAAKKKATAKKTASKKPTVKKTAAKKTATKNTTATKMKSTAKKSTKVTPKTTEVSVPKSRKLRRMQKKQARLQTKLEIAQAKAMIKDAKRKARAAKKAAKKSKRR